jgi:hypothetical protein
MNSTVVGQNRLALHTEVTDGFQVTSERDRYLSRLKACSSPSNPHDDGKFVVRGGVPRGLPCGEQGFDDVAKVEANHDFFVRLRVLGDFEDVRKGVVADLAADEFNRTLAEVIQRSEDRY